MSNWYALRGELARWQDAGCKATLWWRDDDAVRDGPALQRLLKVAAGRAPLALAVVPSHADATLVDAVGTTSGVSVLQHGIAHRDHARDGERRIELGGRLLPGRALAALGAARRRLERRFGTRFVPALVPPWNRIEETLVPRLTVTGLRGLSMLGLRKAPYAAPGLRVVNVHVDVINWRNGRRFAGEERVLAALIATLAAKRGGGHDAAEPTGLMTHHAVHDQACWRFVERLLDVTAAHQACRWEDAHRLFANQCADQ